MPETPAAPSASDVRLLLLTAPSADVAHRIAHSIVEERLAACVNVIPGVTSVYRWRGEIASDSEHLLVVKTTASCAERIERELPRLHPYETPELVALAPAHVERRYLAWLGESCAP